MTRKIIDLDELHEYMFENIKEPITTTDFNKSACKYFNTTPINLSFFIKRVVSKSPHFILYMKMLAPADMKRKAVSKMHRIILSNKRDKAQASMSKKVTETHIKILKSKKTGVNEIGRELGISPDTVVRHKRKSFRLCKICRGDKNN